MSISVKMISALVGALVMIVAVAAYSQTYDDRKALQHTRACAPAPGAAVDTLSVSASDAVAAAMTANTVYGIGCTGTGGAYLQWGSSAPTATSGSPVILADGAIFFFLIDPSGSNSWVAALDVAGAGGSCNIFRCQ